MKTITKYVNDQPDIKKKNAAYTRSVLYQKLYY